MEVWTRLVVVAAFCTLISMADIKTLLIPDRMLYPFWLLLVVIDIRWSYYAVPSRMAGALAMSLAFLAVRQFYGGLGLGDVKLAFVLTYAVGFFSGIVAVFSASVLGLAYLAVARIAEKKRMEKVPFAPFLSIGTLLVMAAGGFV
ncbi:MAG: prepilin peptidase [Treponema sp.]|nr:prepilin peptidase [Treponema sp.]